MFSRPGKGHSNRLRWVDILRHRFFADRGRDCFSQLFTAEKTGRTYPVAHPRAAEGSDDASKAAPAPEKASHPLRRGPEIKGGILVDGRAGNAAFADEIGLQ